MARIALNRSSPENVSRSLVAFRSYSEHSIHFIRWVKAANGFRTDCHTSRNMWTIFASSNRCELISSIMLQHNYLCRPEIHAWVIHPSVRGSFMDWVRRIRTCRDLSCCFPVARTPMAESNYGVPGFFLVFIKACNAGRMEIGRAHV